MFGIQVSVARITAGKRNQPCSLCAALRAFLSLDFATVRNHSIGMNLIVSPHNVTLTRAIEDHIISRIDKLTHLNHYAVKARVILGHDKTKAPERQFSCSIKLSLPGADLFAEAV